MGKNKALLELGGMTALERIARLGAPDRARMETIVVVGADRERTIAEAERLDLRTVENARYERGQTSSLRCGIAAAPPDATHVLVHPVDCPLIVADDYRRLFDAWTSDGAGESRKIFVTSFAMRRGHPLLLPMDVAREILLLPDDGSARDVTSRHAERFAYVLSENPWVIRDLDTPDDLKSAQLALPG